MTPEMETIKCQLVVDTHHTCVKVCTLVGTSGARKSACLPIAAVTIVPTMRSLTKMYAVIRLKPYLAWITKLVYKLEGMEMAVLMTYVSALNTIDLMSSFSGPEFCSHGMDKGGVEYEERGEESGSVEKGENKLGSKAIGMVCETYHISDSHKSLSVEKHPTFVP